MEIPPQLPFCVYILLSEKDGNFYVGITTDLHHRLNKHIHGHSEATALLLRLQQWPWSA